MSVSNVWLTINRACNFRCKWCYTLNNLSNDKNMDYELAKKYILLFAKNGVKKVILIGGEPTLHPRFCDFVSLIKQSGMNVSTATNGQLFSNSDLCRKAVLAGLDSINISLKGTSEVAYKVNTGKEGLKNAVAAYKNALTAGCKNVSFSYVVTQNIDSEFHDLAQIISNVNDGDAKLIVQFAVPEFGRASDPNSTIELGNSIAVLKKHLIKTTSTT